MKETRFIDQNKEKWAEYEQLLRDERPDPERLSELFIQITDDLSYARTFYPNRSVRVFLNSMASRVFQYVYRGKAFPWSRITEFWKTELPQALWEGRTALLLSFSIFSIAFIVGVLSSIIEPEFARVVLGDDYVTMTLRNIENGDPMAVYKESGPLGMTAGIAANNLFVAFRTAMMGVLASLGTVLSLIQNGIMVGVFQYFFISKGLFGESFLTIWIHGTLEISAIIIAGASGLIAGSGLLFPGTYRRIQAFQISIRRGLKIFIGIIPVLVLAAIFEGFLTRFTETPDIIRGLFILASLLFVLWYFVILPFSLWKQGAFTNEPRAPALQADEQEPIRFNVVKTPGEIMGDTITLMRKYGKVSTGIPFISAFITTVFIILPGTQESFSALTGFTGKQITLSQLNLLFAGSAEMPWLFVFQCFISVILIITALSILEKELVENSGSTDEYTRCITIPQKLTVYGGIILLTPVFLFILSLESNTARLLMAFLTFPLLNMMMAVIFTERLQLPGAIHRALCLLQRGGAFRTGFWVIITGIIAMILLGTPVWETAVKFLCMLVPATNDGDSSPIAVFIGVFPTLFVMYMFIFFWTLSGVVAYYSAREIEDARYIQKQISTIGQSRQIRGLPKE